MPVVVQQMIAERPGGRSISLGTFAAVADGTWMCCYGVRPLSVVIAGSFSATAKLYVANGESKPTDSDHNYPQLGDDITAPTLIALADVGVWWVKLRVTAYTSGTMTGHALVG